MTSSNDDVHYLDIDASRALDASRKRVEQLQPFVKPLTSADVESCTTLENAAFPPAERASREIVSLKNHRSSTRASQALSSWLGDNFPDVEFVYVAACAGVPTAAIPALKLCRPIRAKC
jgi:hypothetical protein